MMGKLEGLRTIVTDTMASRRDLALQFGAEAAFDPRDSALTERVKSITEGRGADLVLVAASAKGMSGASGGLLATGCANPAFRPNVASGAN